MKFPGKVIVALDMGDDMLNILRPMKNFDFLKDAEIHLVHVYPEVEYAYPMMLPTLRYPLDEDRASIKSAIADVIHGYQDEFLPHGHQGRIKVVCLFGRPKEKFAEYVKDERAGLVIVPSRDRSAVSRFFESSFAQYACKYLHTPVLVMKPHQA